MTKKIRRKLDKMCRDAFEIFEKKESTYLPSMIPEVFPYTSQFIQVQSLAILACMNDWKKNVLRQKEQYIVQREERI